jgi:hypothetical protein
MHSAFAQFRSIRQDAKDNIASMTTKLTMPVLAIGGEKSFGANEAIVMRNAATNVTELVIPNALADGRAEQNYYFRSECLLISKMSKYQSRAPHVEPLVFLSPQNAEHPRNNPSGPPAPWQQRPERDGTSIVAPWRRRPPTNSGMPAAGTAIGPRQFPRSNRNKRLACQRSA